uniref:CEP295 N-terminal like n=1 Tax=Nannospalax galili TaxID=1026970 RepID=A0A8C6QXR6_NANGA
MQRHTERAADEDASVLRPKPASPQVDVARQQWKVQQLQRLAEALQAEWQETRLQQVRELERLQVARLSEEAAGRTVGSDSEEPGPRGAAGLPRAKERRRTTLRGSWDQCPRQHPKSRKKATGSTETPELNPNDKGRGKRPPSSKRSGGQQPAGRVGRGGGLAKLSPLLGGAGEISREGRRQPGKGTSSRDQSLQDKPTDVEQQQPLNATSKQGATPQGSPVKCSDKNQWHKEMESALEELFNTNRKLKKHLSLHLEQRLEVYQKPDEQQGLSQTQGDSSDTQREETEAETPPEESGSPTEVEASQTWSETNMKVLQSQNDCSRLQMAKYPLKSECLSPVTEVGTSTEQDNSHLEGPGSGGEPPKMATQVEDTPTAHPQRQVDSLASWMTLRQKRAEMDPRRPKTLFEMTEHPDMSLEIHYKAELEEERRERRRIRLAVLKSYPTGFQFPAPIRDPEIGGTSLLDSSLLDEEKQSQMIHDLQQQILEQNKLHKQFLEKARKRLQEFQKTF